MAKCFTEWTVLPHRPIEKLAANLWRVSGRLGAIQRQMVVARRDDGRLLIHNPIALDDGEMQELEAWGEIGFLFVPNGFHRQDALIWKRRYPAAKVVASAGSTRRVGKIVAVDLAVDDVPPDPHVELVALAGCPAEALLAVHSLDGTTLVFCDAVLNVPRARGTAALFLGPTGQVSAPRFARWMLIKDRRAFVAQLGGLADKVDLKRILFAHGAPAVDAAAPAALRTVVAQLGG